MSTPSVKITRQGIEVLEVPTDVSNLENRVTAVEALAHPQVDLTDINNAIAALQALSGQNEGDITTINAAIAALQGDDVTQDASIATINTAIAALQALSGQNEGDVTTINAAVAALETVTASSSASITTLYRESLITDDTYVLNNVFELASDVAAGKMKLMLKKAGVDSSLSGLVSGIQLYVKNMECDEYSSKTEYLPASQKHSALADWTVGMRRVARGMSTLYLEGGSDLDLSAVGDSVELCSFSMPSLFKGLHPKLVSQGDYLSRVVYVGATAIEDQVFPETSLMVPDFDEFNDDEDLVEYAGDRFDKVRDMAMNILHFDTLYPMSVVNGIIEAKGTGLTGVSVEAGIDRLAAKITADSSANPFAGSNVLMMTNSTGKLKNGDFSMTYIAGLCANMEVFTPEHGFYIELPAGESDKVGALSNILPANATSLGGRSVVTSIVGGSGDLDAHVANAHAVVVDIQTLPLGHYTYDPIVGGLINLCAKHGVPIHVFDRPSMLTGDMVAGPFRDSHHTDVIFNWRDARQVYGRTLGYFAERCKKEGVTLDKASSGHSTYGVTPAQVKAVDLTVHKNADWYANMWPDQTDIGYEKPSPNLPSLESALCYPMTVYLEATDLNEGRGADINNVYSPFQVFGAPDLDNSAALSAIQAKQGYKYNFAPGVEFSLIEYTPVSGGPGGNVKHNGELCKGIQITITDREIIKPVETAYVILFSLLETYPGLGYEGTQLHPRHLRNALDTKTDFMEFMANGGLPAPTSFINLDVTSLSVENLTVDNAVETMKINNLQLPDLTGDMITTLTVNDPYMKTTDFELQNISNAEQATAGFTFEESGVQFEFTQENANANNINHFFSYDVVEFESANVIRMASIYLRPDGNTYFSDSNIYGFKETGVAGFFPHDYRNAKSSARIIPASYPATIEVELIGLGSIYSAQTTLMLNDQDIGADSSGDGVYWDLDAGVPVRRRVVATLNSAADVLEVKFNLQPFVNGYFYYAGYNSGAFTAKLINGVPEDVSNKDMIKSVRKLESGISVSEDGDVTVANTLTADTINVGDVAVSNTHTAGTINVGDVTVSNTHTAGTINVGDVTVSNTLTADTINVGDATVSNTHTAGTINVGDVTVANTLTAGTINVGDVPGYSRDIFREGMFIKKQYVDQVAQGRTYLDLEHELDNGLKTKWIAFFNNDPTEHASNVHYLTWDLSRSKIPIDIFGAKSVTINTLKTSIDGGFQHYGHMRNIVTSNNGMDYEFTAVDDIFGGTTRFGNPAWEYRPDYTARLSLSYNGGNTCTLKSLTDMSADQGFIAGKKWYDTVNLPVLVEKWDPPITQLATGNVFVNDTANAISFTMGDFLLHDTEAIEFGYEDTFANVTAHAATYTDVDGNPAKSAWADNDSTATLMIGEQEQSNIALSNVVFPYDLVYRHPTRLNDFELEFETVLGRNDNSGVYLRGIQEFQIAAYSKGLLETTFYNATRSGPFGLYGQELPTEYNARFAFDGVEGGSNIKIDTWFKVVIRLVQERVTMTVYPDIDNDPSTSYAVYNNLELGGPTAASLRLDVINYKTTTNAFRLQHHGGTVSYRDVKLTPIISVTP